MKNEQPNQPNLKTKYQELIPELMKELKVKNKFAVPSITKIVINSGLGEAKVDSKIIDEMVEDIATLAGQRPIVTKSKKSISNFKIREDMDIGVKVTLRRDMMWYFLERLIMVVLPRVKDFRGISPKSFDGRGNYSLGIREHTVFPEVDATKVTKLRGLQVIINTDADTDEAALLLLTKLGMPFKK